MTACIQCGSELTYNDIGAYKKFINRGSKEFMCKYCLAEKLNIDVVDIEQKILHYKEQGCMLFI